MEKLAVESASWVNLDDRAGLFGYPERRAGCRVEQLKSPPTRFFGSSATLLMYQLLLAISVALNFSAASAPTQPLQPADGPGGRRYGYAEVRFSDHAEAVDGFWLFEPAGAPIDTAEVVVFLHGYGGYNPMIYGGWIDHLARQGYVVIYPRYQKDMWHPRPARFAPNVATGVRDALAVLGERAYAIDTSRLSIVGHSYGGVIGADLAVNWSDYQIPEPKSLFLVSPGTGPLKGGRLRDYAGLAADLHLLIITSTGDRVVGDEFGRLVYETATRTTRRNYLVQTRDDYGQPAVTDGHNECYSINPAYDNDAMNWTSKRARRIGRTNAVDYYGYWKLYDALLDFTRDGSYAEYTFGDTPEQRSLGVWEDGTPITPLRVEVPE